jgi:hypothetical protein
MCFECSCCNACRPILQLRSRVPRAVFCLPRHDILHPLVTEHRVFNPGAFALNQVALGARKRHHIDPFVLGRRTVDRTEPSLLPERWDQALEITPFHPDNIVHRDGTVSRYELAKIGDSRAAPAETRIAAFIDRLRELVIRRRVQAEINDERRVVAEAKAA